MLFLPVHNPIYIDQTERQVKSGSPISKRMLLDALS